MLYIIGAGLSVDAISVEALNVLNRANEIYLETYTTPLPFKITEYQFFLRSLLGRDVVVEKATRQLLEDNCTIFLKKAKNKDIALLIYGDPLIATTHLALIKEAKKLGINVKIIHNSSIINAITNTGLSIYRFGKIASMPKWTKTYKPRSFYEIIKQNLSIDAHTLLLVDFDLDFKTAMKQLMEVDKEKLLDLIYTCSCLGTDKELIIREEFKKIINNLSRMDKIIKKPFCFVIPAGINFYENL